ncbi:hypothetical protein [Verrucomicrobium sp. BvORR106]|uniref:hypothetical protein n=1 Tax=Verrucomicrobium sp. BvORR106 TaxID=1403819 RepID=UPI00056FEA35|nr:hypothetical protein [Verrucomicrobium sp. BvORR106]
MKTREFSMEHPRGLRIHRKLGEFEAALLNGVERHDMKTGYVWYYLKDEATNPGRLNVGLCFFNGTLKIVSLSVRDEDLGTSWDDFSEETEHLRAARTEAWLAEHGFPTGEHAWGSIWAGFDAKGGYGSAVIRYD